MFPHKSREAARLAVITPRKYSQIAVKQCVLRILRIAALTDVYYRELLSVFTELELDFKVLKFVMELVKYFVLHAVTR